MTSGKTYSQIVKEYKEKARLELLEKHPTITREQLRKAVREYEKEFRKRTTPQ